MLSSLIVDIISLYVHQMITLYTLNLHSVICQLHLSRAGKKLIEVEYFSSHYQ